MSLQFEWDPKKAKSNIAKHGISFGEAMTVFADPLARIFNDEDHSIDEKREIIIGHSRQQSRCGEFHRPRRESSTIQRSRGNTLGAEKL
jgi:uncharacterized DUF497 family protein